MCLPKENAIQSVDFYFFQNDRKSEKAPQRAFEELGSQLINAWD